MGICQAMKIIIHLVKFGHVKGDIMTNKENLYLNNAELNLYNQIQKEILITKNIKSIDTLKNNAFNLLNNAMYKHCQKQYNN